jgi:hypothetical protein
MSDRSTFFIWTQYHVCDARACLPVRQGFCRTHKVRGLVPSGTARFFPGLQSLDSTSGFIISPKGTKEVPF